MAPLPTGTVTFLFTDIEGSTRLWDLHKDLMHASAPRHDAIVRDSIANHNGFLVKYTGDGFHAVFDNAVDALTAALAAQHALHREQWTEPARIRVRMGLHTGVAQLRDGDYDGSDVNRAARVMASGHGGQVLISEVTRVLVRAGLPSGVELKDLGEHRLTGLQFPERIFQILHPDLPSEFPRVRSDGRPGPTRGAGQYSGDLPKAPNVERITQLLEQALQGESRVVIDRHLQAGVDLAQRLKEEVTRVLARGALPAGVELNDRGEQRLAGLQLPERILQILYPGLSSEVSPVKPGPVKGSDSPPGEKRTVVLVYKRNAPNMERLTDLLERALQDDYRVFIDRHLQVGVDWAQRLKEEVTRAYAIIPLLSAESIWSEMLEYEIRIAHETAQARGGEPHLLPVRVRFEGDLPDPLKAILDPLQHRLWTGPDDDAGLVNALKSSLQNPLAPPRGSRVIIGGALPLDSPLYIRRSTDDALSAALERSDSIILIKGARQMGKTSLLARGIAEARASGKRCLGIDFQNLPTALLEDEDSFYRELAERFEESVDGAPEVDSVWRDRRPPMSNFERYLKAVLKETGPFVWALDEVDKLFTCPFSFDFFGLVRSWHNARATEPDGALGRLTVLISYATEPYLFITNLNQSPFNVGTDVLLADFSVEETEALNRRHGAPFSLDELGRLHALIGGQPYLTQRALSAAITGGQSLDAIERTAGTDDGIFGDHLRRLLLAISSNEESVAIVRDFLGGIPLKDESTFYRLRSGGLLAGHAANVGRFRCPIYATYLAAHLL